MVTQAEIATENVKAGLVYTGYPYVEPGIKVFMICPTRSGDIIIEATVEEINDVYARDENCPGCWGRKDIFGSDNVAIPTGEKDDLGWDKHRYATRAEFLAEFPLARRVNQFLWLDEPIGHGVGLGDEGIFLTLEEAMFYARPSKKKHLKRRLKARRNRYYNFINHTRAMNNEKSPAWPRPINKRIYVRRK